MAATVEDSSSNSSFGDVSTGSSDLSDFEFESEYVGGNRVAIRPYNFEPETSESEQDSNEALSVDMAVPQVIQAFPRLLDQNKTWCSCGNCNLMPTETECICCKEHEVVVSKIREADTDLQCITQHPGFRAVCLDVWVLQTAYLAYRQQYGNLRVNGNHIHKRYRYTAYRQLVRWCWGYLGKYYRVILPACAVTLIRDSFPSVSYSGFEYPRLNL